MITVLVLITVGILVGIYYLYGKRLERNVVRPDDSRATPAVRLRDNVDYMPTNKWVLWGHHFSSIAGLGPIGGPAIAMAWGWLPGLIWIWWANLFIGIVHDYFALMSSVRYDGRTTQWVLGRLTSLRASYFFQAFIYLLFFLAAAGFVAIAIVMWQGIPRAGTVVFLLIGSALITGYLLYRTNLGFARSTIVGLVLVAASIAVAYYFPIKLSLWQWWAIMFVYMVLAARLPVWVLLQPRDYLSVYILGAGFVFGALALIIGFKGLELPAFSMWSARAVGGQPSPFWPMAVMVIMCGALSGGHAILASGVTSKQLARESEGLMIGGGAMMTEGFLASVVVLTLAGYGYSVLRGVSEQVTKLGVDMARLTTDPVYHGNFFLKAVTAAGGPVGMFAKSFGLALNDGLGIPIALGTMFAAVWITTFALTTADTSIRVARFGWTESFDFLEKASPSLHRILTNKWVATIIPAGLASYLGYYAGWRILWPAIAGMNQLAGSLGLLVGALWAWRVLHARRGYLLFISIPALFLWLTVTTALFYYIIRVPALWGVKVIIGYAIFLSLMLMYEFIAAGRRPVPEVAPTSES